ncbi:DegT/DnrJ/EryC1/StrS family aminotransferase [Flavobacterium sp. Fl-77]|uniref:DegT/DnrJ/EryC1/StrS family aminotransferase n=1 Tax=Flavobacterium flavipigmentatum TaxID=2893884 RepID=A0AAJ2SDR1_9FLAO|nr:MULTISPECIES: DegT/DnrJ/EryC1/StrS family aminotransferase [unclassified Flavobacterium]MDX6181906.1 DegT/DnrJ/EryC1/StrS family aminotransferase [Flavobacterium sp. Fl-33]MDX6185060.1 DegT/DnrJ/EryC1/StrS family aminotransferase [Flavobacterium sp. Fl-77]UFH37170.1 DegT/DnrJ/EryC1/StrS family aminotransferase [Flavobacterium sp. F-70]
MIPFLDLKKINEPYEADFQLKLKSVLNGGWYILGKEVQLFEESFARYCNANYCIGVGNGFDALVLIFKGYIQLGKLEKGDEVIVPANTYVASILAILQADLIPVLVEPKLETYNLDPELIAEKITSKTKAILVVHLYGQLAEMEMINEIAETNNFIIVEDSAQSHGAISNLKSKINNQQSSAAYSFYPGKNLGALGDGGAIITNDPKLAKVLYSLRNYGSNAKYYNDYIGFNSRLDELQAAFLNLKLPNLDSDNNKRRAIAKRYLTEIKNDKISLPYWNSSKNHVFHLFVIRTPNRAALQEYLVQNNIQTMIHYPIPPHKQKAFSAWNSLSFPITEKIHNEVLSLPMSPILTESEVGFIIEILNEY